MGFTAVVPVVASLPDLLCPQPRLELQQRATEIVRGADFMRQEIAKPNRISVRRSTYDSLVASRVRRKDEYALANEGRSGMNFNETAFPGL